MKKIILIGIFLILLVTVSIYSKAKIMSNKEDNSKLPAIRENVKIIDNAILKLTIPNDWQYQEILATDQVVKYALELYKENRERKVVFNLYNEPFAVCGTGLSTNEMLLNNKEKAMVGYYGCENVDYCSWSHISLKSNDNMAFLNYDLTKIEEKEVLDFIKTLVVK